MGLFWGKNEYCERNDIVKVYELIQKLSQCDADYEVKVDFVLNRTLDCDICDSSFDVAFLDSARIDDTDFNGNVKEFVIKVLD